VWDPEQPTTGWDKFWELAGFKRIHAMPRKPEGDFFSRIGQEYELGVPGLRKSIGVNLDVQRLKLKDKATGDFRTLREKIGKERYDAVLAAPLGDTSAWDKLSHAEQDSWTRATAQVVNGVQSGVLLPNDADAVARDAQLSPFELHFKKKSITEAMDSYANMPVENQIRVRQLLIDKGPQIKSLRTTEQAEAARRFKDLTEQEPAKRVRSRTKRFFERLENAQPLENAKP
jgi:hypothetical protein